MKWDLSRRVCVCVWIFRDSFHFLLGLYLDTFILAQFLKGKSLKEKINEDNQIWSEKLFIFCLSLWGSEVNNPFLIMFLRQRFSWVNIVSFLFSFCVEWGGKGRNCPSFAPSFYLVKVVLHYSCICPSFQSYDLFWVGNQNHSTLSGNEKNQLTRSYTPPLF